MSEEVQFFLCSVCCFNHYQDEIKFVLHWAFRAHQPKVLVMAEVPIADARIDSKPPEATGARKEVREL